ncbi:UNVERIFIED_CONTAM: hypothetical protein FKN15_000235 [Acipenser sinensis]
MLDCRLGHHSWERSLHTRSASPHSASEAGLSQGRVNITNRSSVKKPCSSPSSPSSPSPKQRKKNARRSRLADREHIDKIWEVLSYQQVILTELLQERSTAPVPLVSSPLKQCKGSGSPMEGSTHKCFTIAGSVPVLAEPFGAGDPGAVDGASGVQAGNRGVTSGLLGGTGQETKLPTVPGGAATWESGPVTRGPDMQPGCLGAQVEGTNPQAPDCGSLLTSLPFVASSSLWGSRHS